MDYYTGPYYSNGKFQNSVAFGSALPTDYTSSQSRLHDSAYAYYPDDRHRVAADWIYSQLLSRDDSIKSSIVRNLPLYGNLVAPDPQDLALVFSPLAILVAAKSAIRLAVTTRDIANGAYNQEITDVLNYYQTDPLKSTHQMGGIITYAIMPSEFAKTDSGPRPNIRVAPETTTTPAVSPDPAVDPPIVYAPTTVPSETLRVAWPDPEQLQGLGTYTPVTEYCHPYRPLKPKKRQRTTLRDVQLYNRYHNTNYTLEQVRAYRGY
jgi:hypothetical protein